MKWSAMKGGMPVHCFIHVTICYVKRPHKRRYIKYYLIVNIVNILQLQSRRNFFIVLLFFKNFCFFPTWSNIWRDPWKRKIVSRLSCDIIFLQRHENYKNIFFKCHWPSWLPAYNDEIKWKPNLYLKRDFKPRYEYFLCYVDK